MKTPTKKTPASGAPQGDIIDLTSSPSDATDRIQPFDEYIVPTAEYVAPASTAAVQADLPVAVVAPHVVDLTSPDSSVTYTRLFFQV